MLEVRAILLLGKNQPCFTLYSSSGRKTDGFPASFAALHTLECVQMRDEMYMRDSLRKSSPHSLWHYTAMRKLVHQLVYKPSIWRNLVPTPCLSQDFCMTVSKSVPQGKDCSAISIVLF